MAEPRPDLPLIDGLVRPPSSGEPVLDERRADLAARVIDAMASRKDLAQRVSQIDVADASTVRAAARLRTRNPVTSCLTGPADPSKVAIGMPAAM